MLSQEESQLFTQTGPGTPAGELLRRYWQPAALTEEISDSGAPLSIRLLGEDLVLFRDDQGRLGLLGLHCSHRGADLSLGRIENGGLRCLYHGWLYDISGRCIEQPSEPRGSEFKDKVRHKSYPAQEAAGIIFAYLGPGAPPLLPAYEPLNAANEQRYVTKTFHACSYLQANEGNLDPAHLSFLHRRMRPESHEPVKGSGGKSPMAFFVADAAPEIEAEETDFGVRIFALRRAPENQLYLRVTNFVLPNLSTIAGPTAPDGYNIHWHVPIDDTHHWRYDIVYRRSGALTADDWQKIHYERGEKTQDYRWIRSTAKKWGQDREAMKTWNFCGIGDLNNQQDTALVESAGPIQNHAEEQLGASDKAIIASRRAILKAIRDVQAGRDPTHLIRSENANRFPHIRVTSELIPDTANWRQWWQAENGSDAA